MPRPDDIVITGATRTAIGRFRGSLATVPAPELGAAVIREALRRSRIAPVQVDEVLMGNVVQAGVGQAPARQAALLAGLPNSIPATTINKVCGSSLKTVMLGAAMIRAGDADVIVAGGMESMNGAPYALPGARFGYRLGNAPMQDLLIHDGLWCATENQHMGLSAEWIAKAFDITREAMDRYALTSHQRAVAALDRGAFEGEITPIMVARREGEALFAEDECPRRDTDADKLARLAPAFCEGGRVTAGNSSAIADGAAALVLMRRDQAEGTGCTPLAHVEGYAQAAVKPLEIFTAPILAIRRVLAKTGMTYADLDLIELNEAFAAQVLADIGELRLDPERVNVNGGAIALGHPIGASGARVLVTLLHALAERDRECGVAALCLGGGEAVSMVVTMENDPRGTEEQ